jgi:hypothetical protein
LGLAIIVAHAYFASGKTNTSTGGDNLTKKTGFWNGKNMAGESHAGVKGLISEGPRTSPTQSKYQVSTDTVSATDLQANVEAPDTAGKHTPG